MIFFLKYARIDRYCVDHRRHPADCLIDDDPAVRFPRFPMATEDRRLEIARQVRGLSALHARTVAACWDKCVPRPREADLHIGEMACIDRCVPKLIETFDAVGKELDAHRAGLPAPPEGGPR
jgi:hypothetical protein